jgi:DNA (cytosine-5)-methyltransferase 1
MAEQLIVRNVPPEVSDWISAEQRRRRVTQQELLLELLVRRAQAKEKPRRRSGVGTSGRAASDVTRPIPFRFVDIFAGIGGFRFALERLNGTCVYSCEWDKYAQKTYSHWFDGDIPVGDIRSVDPESIPDHDVLAAGFPCQPFSIAGVSKKKSLGYAHGFKCAAQGTLFFDLARIIESKRPPVLMLENVKNLMSHDTGNTWRVIREHLERLDYKIFAEVLDARHWVPQHRERIFIVGFDKAVFGESIPFAFPSPPSQPKPKLRDILETDPDIKYTLTQHLWSYLQGYAARHAAKGNGFGFGIADLDGVTRTLSARYYKDGSEILIPTGNRRPPRRLTPVECARLMGFDADRYPIVVSDTQAYRQFGNAVVPKVAEEVGRQVLSVLEWRLLGSNGCLLKRGGPDTLSQIA